MSVGGCQAWAMTRTILQDIAINGRHLHVVLRNGALGLHAALQPVRVSIGIVQVTTHAKVGIAESQVGNGLLAMIAPAETRTVKLLTLQLVLDTFAVGGIADQRKDRSNALDKQRTLSRFGVVQSSLRTSSAPADTHVNEAYLYTVISIRVSEQLLEPSAV